MLRLHCLMLLLLDLGGCLPASSPAGHALYIRRPRASAEKVPPLMLQTYVDPSFREAPTMDNWPSHPFMKQFEEGADAGRPQGDVPV